MNTRLLLSFFFLLFTLPAMAQKNTGPYANEWQKIDSLLGQGLPQSAAKNLQNIYNKAKASGQPVQQLKAQIYLLHTQNDAVKRDSPQVMLRTALQEAKTQPFPISNIWHSLAAEIYSDYYNQHSWQIRERTALATPAPGANISEWDARQFISTITAHYRASLARPEELIKTRLDAYDAVIVKGINTANLRPTLYDLLAFRAIDYYETGVYGLTQPADQFAINDSRVFSDVVTFIALRFTSTDTASEKLKALRTYQQLLALHLNDAKPDALLDANLHRLAYVNNNAVMPDKEERYRRALQALADDYTGNAAAGEALFRIQQLKYNKANAYRYNNNEEEEQPKKDKQLPALKTALEEIVATYPKTEGSTNAANLLSQIMRTELNLQTEEVSLPGEPSKVLVTYRNVTQASFRVIAVTEKMMSENNRYNIDSAAKAKLLKSPPLQQWTVQLPGTADLDQHSTEVKVDALPLGMYALLISGKEDFSANDNNLSVAYFQVSSLAMVTLNNSRGKVDGFVMDRKSGKPMGGVKMEITQEKYNQQKRENEVTELEVLSSNDGSFVLPGEGHITSIVLIRGNDRLMRGGSFYHESNDKNRHDIEDAAEDDTTIQFFTDRAIYRPGQTVYFKGIGIRENGKTKAKNIVANYKTTVWLEDVNANNIDSLAVTTNDYGSFSGSFVLPVSGLTGEWKLYDAESYGEQSFSVEEYKRPKFAVTFDTLKGSYALNKEVNISGKAESFAGAPIDGAVVKYKVTRQARYPYWGSYYRGGGYPSDAQEISSGTVKTGVGGDFSIVFTTIPDKTIDSSTLPVFTYNVSVDITDANGETRSGSQAVQSGYTNLLLSSALPESASLADTDSFHVFSSNLNSVFTPADVTVKVEKLNGPSGILRKPRWSKPDQFVMDEATHKQFFPRDEYKGESDYKKWPAELTYSTTKRTKADGSFGLPRNAFPANGWYRTSMESKDSAGRKVVLVKYVLMADDKLSGDGSGQALAMSVKSVPQKIGDRASVTVQTAFEQANLFKLTAVESGETTSQTTLKSKKQESWASDAILTPGNTVKFLGWIVKDNRVYQAERSIALPAVSHDLAIVWATHRDKLQPGEAETWTMTIKGKDKEKVVAEMVASLYDASLDEFKKHQFLPNSDEEVYDRSYLPPVSLGLHVFSTTTATLLSGRIENNYNFAKAYPRIFNFTEVDYLAQRIRPGNPRGRFADLSVMGARTSGNTYIVDGIVLAPGSTAFTNQTLAAADQLEAVMVKNGGSAPRHMMLPDPNDPRQDIQPTPITPRKNLRETAFFFPQLRTDAEGNIVLKFTMPEALTQWRLLAFAHTKDMRTGLLEGSIRTQKDLMVVPGIPRFFRQGDEISVSAKINNLSIKSLNGTANIEILDAATLKPLNVQFGFKEGNQAFSMDAGRSTAVSWKLRIPQARYEPVVVRITARAGSFTDGEDNTLPVLTNRTLVTETLPIWMNGDGTKTFSFPIVAKQSNTLAPHTLTTEYTSNPAWLAVQALPYLTEYPYECAEQTFNRYYANALAQHIVEQAPRLREIFRKWEKVDTAALLSKLEQNQELKSALLEETPWVLEAQSENEQKHNIALLFQNARMASALNSSLQKLTEMQSADGSFPWFKGGSADRYITQYIATGIARLEKLGISSSDASKIRERAQQYSNADMVADYKRLVAAKANMDEPHIGAIQVQQLYLQSLKPGKLNAETQTAINYYNKQARKYWPSFNPSMKAMTAMAVAEKATPILQSLRETAIADEEQGLYWIRPGYSYYWQDAPIETQAVIMEAFANARDESTVNAAKLWLLRQKQTQNWGTTKATADACYALLMQGSDWLRAQPDVTIKLGETSLSSGSAKTEAGTGYFKTVVEREKINPAMSTITLTTKGTAKGAASWGAVYYQYFEDIDKITASGDSSRPRTPIAVKKQFYIQRNTGSGPQLEEIKEGNAMKVGDKVIVRIVLSADRDMDYVHLKDSRAACFEPVNVLSGYKWQAGIGYYESTRDASSNFFISSLRKGTYVFEYPVHVTATGNFSSGIATAQCMYAPEFSSHSAGTRVEVK